MTVLVTETDKERNKLSKKDRPRACDAKNPAINVPKASVVAMIIAPFTNVS